MADADPSDAELLARLRRGDGESVGLLYDRYEGPVFRYLVGVLKDHAAAEDVLQDTFVLVLRRADAAGGDSFRGWLFSVAHQQALLFRRRGKRLPAAAGDGLLALVGTAPDPAAEAERRDDAAAVRGLLAALPESQQEVIRLRLFDGLKFREVADRLGCPLNTALARMHDALSKLRTLWEQRYA